MNYIWKCEIKVRDSNIGTSCTSDASTFGEVSNEAVRTMYTSLIYDKEFCTKCKVAHEWLQSDFFKVTVVSSCSGLDCSVSKGKFKDFNKAIYKDK